MAPEAPGQGQPDGAGPPVITATGTTAAGEMSVMRPTFAPDDAARHTGPGRALGTVTRMRAFQRVALALGVAGLVSAVVRLRGRGANVTPPSSGGWRPLEGPDLQ